MHYISHYPSPLGNILLAADETGLTGLWFEGQKHYARTLAPLHEEADTPVLAEAKQWLDIYFSGRNPDFLPPLHPCGTEFQQAVWNILLTIPYGSVCTYGEIAARLADQRSLISMSAQAVGGAVGRNPISLFIPCHRVVGANGALTGYAGGIGRKTALLHAEASPPGLFPRF